MNKLQWQANSTTSHTQQTNKPCACMLFINITRHVCCLCAKTTKDDEWRGISRHKAPRLLNCQLPPEKLAMHIHRNHRVSHPTSGETDEWPPSPPTPLTNRLPRRSTIYNTNIRRMCLSFPRHRPVKFPEFRRNYIYHFALRCHVEYHLQPQRYI